MQRHASAVYAVVLCLSQVDVVLKRLKNVGSRKQHHMIAQGLFSFLLPKILAKLKRRYPQPRHQMQVG